MEAVAVDAIPAIINIPPTTRAAKAKMDEAKNTKGAPASSRSKATTKKKSGKKSYLAQVQAAILALKEADGSSRAAIAKHLKEKGSDNKNALSRALKQGIASGKLEQGTSKSRFRIKGVAFKKKDDGL